MKNRTVMTAAAILGAIAFPNLSSAQPADDAAGTLTCVVDAPGEPPVMPRERVICDFFSSADGRATRFNGRITDVGLDAGEVDGGHMTWLVLKADPAVKLTGVYGPATAYSDLNRPDNPKVLSKQGGGVILQPYLLEGHGLNYAVGVTALTLSDS